MAEEVLIATLAFSTAADSTGFDNIVSFSPSADDLGCCN
jgi:hypothetical protein